jgi:hypothetical protein
MSQPTAVLYFNGHLITAVHDGETWNAQIDADVPVMERQFELRSTYSSSDLDTVMRVAKCEIAGDSEVVAFWCLSCDALVDAIWCDTTRDFECVPCHYWRCDC